MVESHLSFLEPGGSYNVTGGQGHPQSEPGQARATSLPSGLVQGPRPSPSVLGKGGGLVQLSGFSLIFRVKHE